MSPRLCSVDNCASPACSRGLCNRHDHRLRAHDTDTLTEAITWATEAAHNEPTSEQADTATEVSQ